jgi:hypothetical protein
MTVVSLIAIELCQVIGSYIRSMQEGKATNKDPCKQEKQLIINMQLSFSLDFYVELCLSSHKFVLVP